MQLYKVELKQESDWISYSGPFNGSETAKQLKHLKRAFPNNSFRKVRSKSNASA